MKYKQFLIVLIVAISFFSITSAQDDLEAFEPVTIPNTEFRFISSEYVEQDFRLYISLPPSYEDSDKAYPVLYLLDPIGTFGAATDIAWATPLPEMIIVGIGYPPDADFLGLRERDYVTDADVFLQFIDEELTPFIDENYRTEPSERAIVGWSYGGYFVLYALFNGGDTFNRYLAISPVIEDNLPYLVVSITQFEQDFADTGGQLYAKLFLSNGTLQDLPVSTLRNFAENLQNRAYLGLEITTLIVEDATHTTVMPTALTRGMADIYCSSPEGCDTPISMLRSFQLIDAADFPIGTIFITPELPVILKSRPIRTAVSAGNCTNMEATVLNAAEVDTGQIWVNLDCGDSTGWALKTRLGD